MIFTRPALEVPCLQSQEANDGEARVDAQAEARFMVEAQGEAEAAEEEESSSVSGGAEDRHSSTSPVGTSLHFGGGASPGGSLTSTLETSSHTAAAFGRSDSWDEKEVNAEGGEAEEDVEEEGRDVVEEKDNKRDDDNDDDVDDERPLRSYLMRCSASVEARVACTKKLARRGARLVLDILGRLPVVDVGLLGRAVRGAPSTLGAKGTAPTAAGSSVGSFGAPRTPDQRSGVVEGDHHQDSQGGKSASPRVRGGSDGGSFFPGGSSSLAATSAASSSSATTDGEKLLADMTFTSTDSDDCAASSSAIGTVTGEEGQGGQGGALVVVAEETRMAAFHRQYEQALTDVAQKPVLAPAVMNFGRCRGTIKGLFL